MSSITGDVLIYTFSGTVCMIIFIVLYRNLFIKEHTWIIEPNSSVQICSVLVPLLFTLSSYGYSFIYICLVINIWISNYWWVDFLSVIVGIIDNLARFSYYMYLILNIQHNMQTNEIVKIVINKRFKILLTIIKIMLLLNILVQAPSYYIIAIYQDNENYKFVNSILYVILTIFYDFSLLYVYIASSHKYAQYWYTKCWKEYDKWGLTQRQHEILLLCSRYCVAFGISVIADIVVIIFYIIYSVNKNNITLFLWDLFDAIDNISFCIAIYWSYPFSYQSYLKFVGSLHNKVYQWILTKHRKEIHNGYIELDDFYQR